MFNPQELRREYRLKALDIHQLDVDPASQFKIWLHEAQQAQILEVNAMTLSTASAEGRPSCRTVLLKVIDPKGFVFFTNYESRKGQDLAANPFACVTFFWRELERQVIISGQIEKLTQAESEIYFASRPRETQVAAWASKQDQVIASREVLEDAYQHYEKLYVGQKIPLPPYWGGYRLLPNRFEFWQGREHRLHDRFAYRLEEERWLIERLAP